ncbi:GlxA family transcriptional regulator [Phytomonospora endophytica]|uniref:Transcriptional regulator GlxA family with amidase domain n=1 Tax=Phytomonospora endophytica TaxID=714109 RepID=A0A841FFL9_9ACTN|nr:helix-turn-helix domain-containing protein [Phytomonospora endophytica]MBB6035066.1 transcriptional regulator GlxA family with amidase domain [Phytomonospora endophytica]GIG64187.1 transcriptional regulator [Phytomonospora endophytica]
MTDTPHKVAVLAVPPVKSFDFSMPSTVLGAVAVEGRAGYEIRVCTADPGVVEGGTGVDVLVRHGLDALDWAETVIVPSTGARHDADGRALDALRRAAGDGKRVASICSGAFVLAQAGLLDGRPATTHWGLAEEFAGAFPAVDVRPDVLFVDEGPVLTSAGAAAGIDLCLHLVRSDHGSAVAAAAARATVVTPVRSGGQAQFIEHPLPPENGGSLAATRDWALARLDRTLGLTELAAHARMSVRTLTRRFRAETGVSPQQWLLRQRIERARAILESTTLPVDRVARESGIGSAESLRQHMIRHVGLTPSAYRAAFRSAA